MSNWILGMGGIRHLEMMGRSRGGEKQDIGGKFD